MQMIAHYKVKDYSAFKTAFDEHVEDRDNAGLSLLQLWREDNGNAWALYQVNNGAATRAYLDGAAGVFNSLAGVTSAEFHMVETA